MTFVPWLLILSFGYVAGIGVAVAVYTEAVKRRIPKGVILRIPFAGAIISVANGVIDSINCTQRTGNQDIMKTTVLCLVIVCLGAATLKAQDSTSSAKLDTLLILQKRALEQQQRIYDEVVRYQEPLADKSAGIEFNPAYLIFSGTHSYLVLSGGLSLFAVNRHAEIAMPFFIQSGAPDVTDGTDLTLWNQDLIYRKFLGRHQDGFFIEGGLRYTYIKGERDEGITFMFIDFGPTHTGIITTNKVGAMFGVGYRYFSVSGLYWGTSFKYGAYFSADERAIKHVILDDTKTIVDFEILKFGIAF